MIQKIILFTTFSVAKTLKNWKGREEAKILLTVVVLAWPTYCNSFHHQSATNTQMSLQLGMAEITNGTRILKIFPIWGEYEIILYSISYSRKK